MEIKEEPILPDNPESATLVNMDIWKSRTGKLFVDEDAARLDGSTVSICVKCGGYAKKHWSICDNCRAIEHNQLYEGLELVEWDTKTPLVGFGNDNYMWDIDEIWDYCNENQCQPSDLKLVLCEPKKYPELNYDYFEEVLPEDGDIDEKLAAKIDEFNEFLLTLAIPSWQPTNRRVSLADFDDLDWL